MTNSTLIEQEVKFALYLRSKNKLNLCDVELLFFILDYFKEDGVSISDVREVMEKQLN